MSAGVELGRLLELLAVAHNPPAAAREGPVPWRTRSGTGLPGHDAPTETDLDDPVFAWRYLRGIRRPLDRGSGNASTRPLPEVVPLAAPVSCLCEIAPGVLACGDLEGTIRILVRAARGRWDCLAVLGERSAPMVGLARLAPRRFASVDAAGVVEVWTPGPFATWTPRTLPDPVLPGPSRVPWIMACGAELAVVRATMTGAFVEAWESRTRDLWSLRRTWTLPGEVRAADAIDGRRVAIATADPALHVVELDDPDGAIRTLGLRSIESVLLGLDGVDGPALAVFGELGGMTCYYGGVGDAPWRTVDAIAFASASVQAAATLPAGRLAIATARGDVVVHGPGADDAWIEEGGVETLPFPDGLRLAALCDGRLAIANGGDVLLAHPDALGGWSIAHGESITRPSAFERIAPLDAEHLLAWRPGEPIWLVTGGAPPTIEPIGPIEPALLACGLLSSDALVVQVGTEVILYERNGGGSWSRQALPGAPPWSGASRFLRIDDDRFALYDAALVNMLVRYERVNGLWSPNFQPLPHGIVAVVAIAGVLALVSSIGQHFVLRPDGALLTISVPAPPDPDWKDQALDAAAWKDQLVVLMVDGSLCVVAIDPEGSATVSSWRPAAPTDGPMRRVLVDPEGQVVLFGEDRRVHLYEIGLVNDQGVLTARGTLPRLGAIPRHAALGHGGLVCATVAGLYRIVTTDDTTALEHLVFDPQVICHTQLDRDGRLVSRLLAPRDPARPWQVRRRQTDGSEEIRCHDPRLHPWLGQVTADGDVLESWQADEPRLAWVGLEGDQAAALRIHAEPPP